jgi:ABC-type sugar transport system ATPase subunit
MPGGPRSVTRGEIRLDGVDVSGRPPKDRDIAMVFQNYALYPHMTVAENMGLNLRTAGIVADGASLGGTVIPLSRDLLTEDPEARVTHINKPPVINLAFTKAGSCS